MESGSASTVNQKQINVAILGPCGAGKSTLCGSLLANTKTIDQRTVEKIKDIYVQERI